MTYFNYFNHNVWKHVGNPGIPRLTTTLIFHVLNDIAMNNQIYLCHWNDNSNVAPFFRFRFFLLPFYFPYGRELEEKILQTKNYLKSSVKLPPTHYSETSNRRTLQVIVISDSIFEYISFSNHVILFIRGFSLRGK